jgi:hypothetical protein
MQESERAERIIEPVTAVMNLLSEMKRRIITKICDSGDALMRAKRLSLAGISPELGLSPGCAISRIIFANKKFLLCETKYKND